jgi:hypothetical protein
MPNAAYPLLLLLVVFVLGSAFFKSDLFGYALLLGFAIALMLVIRHYSELYVWGLAAQARAPLARYFLANSTITVASIAPALMLGLVWLFRERLHAFALYATATAVATSGLATGYDEFKRLATYYPHFSFIGVLGQSNEFAIVGAVIPVALSIAALCKARPALTIPQPVRRAASALHGESNWFPTEQARRWFDQGGIVIGEAYRPDLNPKLAGKAPLLRYDGDTGSGHVLVFAGSGGYKTTGTVIPSALEWPSGLVCSIPRLKWSVWFIRPGAPWAIAWLRSIPRISTPIPSTRSTGSTLPPIAPFWTCRPWSAGCAAKRPASATTITSSTPRGPSWVACSPTLSSTRPSRPSVRRFCSCASTSRCRYRN